MGAVRLLSEIINGKTGGKLGRGGVIRGDEWKQVPWWEWLSWRTWVFVEMDPKLEASQEAEGAGEEILWFLIG